MATLCRTCGQEAEHAQSLFDKKSSDVLYNILKLTGLWLSEKPDVPSRICLSCLLDLKEAIAFRERCIKTNSSWFNEQEEDQNALHLEIFPVSTLEPKMIPSQRHVPHQQTSKPDERSSKAIDDPICPLIIPDVSLGELMDPLRCEIIPVKNEPLYLDEEAEQIRDPETVDEEKNQEDTDRTSEKQLIADDDSSKHSSNHEVTKRNHSLTIKKRGRPCKAQKTKSTKSLKDITIEEQFDSPTVKRNRTTEEKYAVRRKWAAVQRARAKELRLFFCDQCGKTFAEKCNFNVHLTRHKGTKEFQCQECDRREFTQHLLNLHVRIKHRGELPYVCKYCGQRFDNCLKRLFHERNHKESPVHRPHVCPVCKKTFKNKQGLKNHSVVHTGEQPFKCELCQSHFNRRNSLQTHFKSKQHRLRAEEQAKIDNGEKS